jgi:hypothetical protein
MRTVLYKAGYVIKVTSWENDGDNYATAEINVETRKDAEHIVKLVKLFTSISSTPKGIGNIYEPSESDAEKVHVAFMNLHNEYPEFIHTIPENEEYICDSYHDLIYDLGLSSSEYYTRVLSKVQVLYFPEDVICEEVTDEFASL